MSKFNLNLGEDLKKLVLAGIGAVAETSDRANELVEHLVEKGELTVEQGKNFNEELKRNIKDAVQESTASFKKEMKPGLDAVMSKMEDMTAEEIQAVKAKIDEINAAKAEDVTCEAVDDTDDTTDAE